MFEEERKRLAESGATLRNEGKWPGSTEANYEEIYTWINKRFSFIDEMYNGVGGK